MKVNVRIKNLPKEFDFKSNINPYKPSYHAKETEDGYVVDEKWHYSKDEFHKYFVRKEFVICETS